jgi:hypothetical protein
MDEQKLTFLKTQFVPLLRNLTPDAKGKWGVMNAQHMVEHFGDAVKNAAGKLTLPLVHEGDHLAKLREFMMSEKPFRENTKNPLLGPEPQPLRQPNMEAAVDRLQKYLNYFFEAFEENPGMTTQNPIFGELDYTANVQLLHKHAMHHLRQFGLI